jgi:hypothetical protein
MRFDLIDLRRGAEAEELKETRDPRRRNSPAASAFPLAPQAPHSGRVVRVPEEALLLIIARQRAAGSRSDLDERHSCIVGRRPMPTR